MSDTEKSKEALLAELRSLRQQVAELETGHRVRVGGIATDITERKQAEEELQQSEARYRFEAIYRAQPYAVIFANTNRQISMCNPAFTKIFGYREKEALGRTTQFLYASDAVYEEMGRQRFNLTAAQKPEPYEVSYRRKNGEVFWGETVGTLVDDAEGKRLGYLGMIMDITERKQAEEALQESEERLRLVIDAMPAFISYADAEQRYRFVNRHYEKRFGLLRSEIVGRHIEEILGKPTYQAILPHIEVALSGQSLSYETTMEFEGLGRRTLEVAYIPDVGPEGGVRGYYVLALDITERKQAEAEREHLIVELEAKNVELERFTYTVSHDLKSPLVTIKGFLGLLEKDVAVGNAERVKKDMEQISTAADKMGRLLDDLLELSRIGHLVNPPEAVSLTELACEAVEQVAGGIAECRAEVEIDPEMPVVYGDRVRLLEVLQNLIDNAVKYMGDQPAPHIAISGKEEGQEVVCSVRDNGIGIDPRYHEKVFGLFERLDNNRTEGTGIGLALAKGIVAVHGGRIWVESDGPGHGSTFCFTLPKRPS